MASSDGTPREVTVTADRGAAELVMSVRHSAAPALSDIEATRLRAVEDYLMQGEKDE